MKAETQPDGTLIDRAMDMFKDTDEVALMRDARLSRIGHGLLRKTISVARSSQDGSVTLSRSELDALVRNVLHKEHESSEYEASSVAAAATVQRQDQQMRRMWVAVGLSLMALCLVAAMSFGTALAANLTTQTTTTGHGFAGSATLVDKETGKALVQMEMSTTAEMLDERRVLKDDEGRVLGEVVASLPCDRVMDFVESGTGVRAGNVQIEGDDGFLHNLNFDVKAHKCDDDACVLKGVTVNNVRDHSYTVTCDLDGGECAAGASCSAVMVSRGGDGGDDGRELGKSMHQCWSEMCSGYGCSVSSLSISYCMMSGGGYSGGY